jgi:hypothetical protein
VYLDHYNDRDDSSGVGWILFAMLMFAVAAISFTIAIAAAHLWLGAVILLHISEGKWFRAGWWTCVLVLLIAIDVRAFT